MSIETLPNLGYIFGALIIKQGISRHLMKLFSHTSYLSIMEHHCIFSPVKSTPKSAKIRKISIYAPDENDVAIFASAERLLTSATLSEPKNILHECHSWHSWHIQRLWLNIRCQLYLHTPHRCCILVSTLPDVRRSCDPWISSGLWAELTKTSTPCGEVMPG